MTSMDEAIDYIAVPRSRVPEVLRMLSGVKERTPSTRFTGSLGWDEGSLRELVLHAQPRQAEMLKLLAEHPDEVVTAHEMEEHLGLRGRAVGGVTSALRKRCRWYDGRDLPFERGWWSNANSYRMPAENARAVLRALLERD